MSIWVEMSNLPFESLMLIVTKLRDCLEWILTRLTFVGPKIDRSSRRIRLTNKLCFPWKVESNNKQKEETKSLERRSQRLPERNSASSDFRTSRHVPKSIFSNFLSSTSQRERERKRERNRSKISTKQNERIVRERKIKGAR